VYHRYAPVKRTLWVILPVRGVNQGKSRLARVLDRGARVRLNRWLLRSTLNVIGQWQGDLSRCVVVSVCEQSLHLAGAAGSRVLAEHRPSRGLSAAVGDAARYAFRHGAKSILVIPSDLPRLSVAALDRIAMLAADGVRCVIARDRSGTGTNALWLRNRRFTFCYGIDSYAHHLAQASRRGWEFSVCDHPDLALDVDTPDDLDAWIFHRSTRHGC
jgi:2-phospho-L-lactate guanylyltransferase